MVITMSELAEFTGINIKTLYAYASPSKMKIIRDGNSVDLSLGVNKAFFDEKRLRESLPVDKVVVEEKVSAPKEKSTMKKKTVPLAETNPAIIKMDQIRIEKDELALKKVKQEMELRDIEIQKKKGQLISADSIVTIIETYSDSMKRDMEIEIQTLIREMSARYKIPSEKSTLYIKRVTDIINAVNEGAVKDVMDKLKRVVK